MPIAAGLWDIVIWTFWFMLLVAWISLLFACVSDLFRDHELGGGAKAGWVILLIVLPLFGCLIYMFARGDSMNRRAAKRNVARASRTSAPTCRMPRERRARLTS